MDRYFKCITPNENVGSVILDDEDVIRQMFEWVKEHPYCGEFIEITKEEFDSLNSFK